MHGPVLVLAIPISAIAVCGPVLVNPPPLRPIRFFRPHRAPPIVSLSSTLYTELALVSRTCYAVEMSPPEDEVDRPPRSKTHDWPPYRRNGAPKRPKVDRPMPQSELERLAFPEWDLRRPPICGGKITPVGDAEEGWSRDRPQHLQCNKPAGTGTDHEGFGACSRHGGGTRSGRKSGAMDAGRYFILQRKAEMVMFGGDPDTINLTPEEAILEEVRRSVAMVRYIQAQIAGWDPGVGDLGALPSLADETTRGLATETDASGWIKIYREERAHMIRVSKMAIDVGISLLLVKLAQEQGLRLASAVERILEELHLTPAQAQLVPVIVPKVLSQFADMPQAPIESPVLQGVVIE